jgi:AAA domain
MAAEPRLTALELTHAALVAGPEPAASSWTPVTVAEIPDTEPVRPELASTGLVYPGKRHVFSGPPESAKTLAAYCVLIQVARHGGTGMLVDFEMGPAEAKQRLRELGATRDELTRILYLEPAEPSNIEHVFALIAYKPLLVVIDAAAGAYSLEGLDDNKRQDVERFSRNYVTIFWRNGIATILIDHVVKDAETRGRFAIGSERKLGGADVHYGFEIVKPISRGTHGAYKIVNHKDRAGYMKRGHFADVKLDSDPDTHLIEWSFTEPVVTIDAQGKFRNTIIMEKISRELRGVTEPLSKAEVKRRVGGNSDRAGKAIDTMLDEGFLTATSGAHGSINLTLTRPYSRNSDPLLHPDPDAPVPPVPILFSSCSGTGDMLTCSPVPSPTGEEQVQEQSTAPQNSLENDDLFRPQGWFTDNGQLDDAAWLASIDPGDDDLFTDLT